MGQQGGRREKAKPRRGKDPSEAQLGDVGVDLYRLEYLAEVFLITFGMPIFTFKVNGLTKLEIDIFNVLIAQRALFHGFIHLRFRLDI